jgi:hypothetical protein
LAVGQGNLTLPTFILPNWSYAEHEQMTNCLDEWLICETCEFSEAITNPLGAQLTLSADERDELCDPVILSSYLSQTGLP